MFCIEAPLSPKTAAVTCSAVRLHCHPKQGSDMFCIEAPLSPKTAAVTCSAVRLACSPLSHPKQLQWHAFSLVKFVIWFWLFGFDDVLETTTQQQTHFQQNTLFSKLFIFIPPITKLVGVYWNHCGHLSVFSSCPSVYLSMCPASSRRYLLNTTTFF